MRLGRPVLLAAAVLAAIAAWPQELSIPPVDHSLHPLIPLPEDRPPPSVTVRVAPDTMDGFNVFLDTVNFRFTPRNLGGPAVANEGHAHLYLNGAKVARMYSPWHHLPMRQLRPGVNRLEVELSANDHSVWGLDGSPVGADVLIDTRDEDGDAIVREEVRYTLDWDLDRTRRHPAGGWSVRTDRGYSVRVTEGRLVTSNLELVPCHALEASPATASLFGQIGPAAVLAGHSSLLPNESKISRSYEEDLADPAALFLEARVVTDPEYCQAHYLVARPRRSRPGTLALDIAGTWARPEGGAAGGFRIQSAGAYGQFLEFSAGGGARIERRAIVGGIDVTVRRSLGSLFDGIDFAAGAAQASGMRVMRRLVADTAIVIAGG